MRQRHMTFLILLLASVLQTTAQTLNDRYNRQRPVVIILDESHYCEAIVKAVANEVD